MAAELGALIIDGGTQSGVMAMMGEAVARDPGTSQLLGNRTERESSASGNAGASAGSDGPPLEPNHSHFVLVETAMVQRDRDEVGTARASMRRSLQSSSTAARLRRDEALQSVRKDGNSLCLMAREIRGRIERRHPRWSGCEIRRSK